MADDRNIYNFTRPDVARNHNLIGYSFYNGRQEFEEPFNEEPNFNFRNYPPSFVYDGSLALNQKAIKNAHELEQERKMYDYMEQQLTQKLQTNVERKRLPTVTQLVQPLKPGQISYGVRTIRTDLKMSEESALEEELKRHQSMQVAIAPPSFHDFDILGPPKLDLPSVNGMLADELEHTHLAVSTKQFLDGILAKQQLQFLRCFATDGQNQPANSADHNIEDKPHQFVEPRDGETETCARVRPLIKAAKRVLIAISNSNIFKVQPMPTLTPNVSTVQNYPTCNRDVTSFTTASRMCPEAQLMPKTVPDRAFDRSNHLQGSISAFGNPINFSNVRTLETASNYSSVPRYGKVRTSISSKLVPKRGKPEASKNPLTEIIRIAASPLTKPLGVRCKPKVPYQPAIVPNSLPQDKSIRTRRASIMPSRGIRQGRISKSKSNKNLLQHDAIRNEALPPSQIKANVATRQWSFTQGLVSTNLNQFAKSDRR